MTGAAFAEVAKNVMHRVHIRNIQLAPTKKVKITRK
jgi:ATP-binding protein involved in chromosome partitioning